jgi:hypothetical protein
VVTRAGVTQREFSEEFACEEELFCVTFDHGQALIAQTLIAAVRDQKRWLSRVRTAVVTVLRFFDQEPQWAELLLLCTPRCGTPVLERREQILGRLAQLLERGAPKSTATGLTLKSGLTAELVIGGAFSVIQGRMLKHRGMPLIELAPSLMSLIVLPYLGADQANAELARRPTPKPEFNELKAKPGPARRASYRTALVLAAIAGAPEANNRAIAQAAGLSDEGQTSKLLSRLRRQGLIENVGLGQAYGEPNAWLLTKQGERAAQTLERGLPREGRAAQTRQRAQGTTIGQGGPAAKANAKSAQPAPHRRGRATCQS